MVRQCEVCKKIGYHHPSLSFHRFPATENLRMVWLSALGYDHTKRLTKSPLICCEHFEERDFHIRPSGMKVLKKAVVPKPYFSASEGTPNLILTDEKFTIPSEEFIVKQEPDESPNYRVDAITEGASPSLLQVKEEPAEGNQQRPVIVVYPMTENNALEKYSLADYTQWDMRNPFLAARFHVLAQSLLKENQLMSIRIEKLEGEIKRLKEEIDMRKWASQCSVCNVPYSKFSNRRVVGGTTQVSTTQKSGNTTEESGNTTQESGNTTQESENTTQKSGNTTQESGNTTQKSGNVTQESGNITQKSSKRHTTGGRLAQVPDTSLQMRKAIVEMSEAGKSISEIARHFGKSRSCIRFWIRRGTKGGVKGLLTRMAGRGRPRITSQAEDEAMVQMAAEEPFSSAITVQEQAGMPYSLWTLRRRLKEALNSGAPARKISPMTPDDMAHATCSSVEAISTTEIDDIL